MFGGNRTAYNHLLSHFSSLWNADAVNVNWSVALNTFAYREQRPEMIKAERLYNHWVILGCTTRDKACDQITTLLILYSEQWQRHRLLSVVVLAPVAVVTTVHKLAYCWLIWFSCQTQWSLLVWGTWLTISDCSNWSLNVYEEPSLMKSVSFVVRQ